MSGGVRPQSESTPEERLPISAVAFPLLFPLLLLYSAAPVHPLMPNLISGRDLKPDASAASADCH